MGNFYVLEIFRLLSGLINIVASFGASTDDIFVVNTYPVAMVTYFAGNIYQGF